MRYCEEGKNISPLQEAKQTLKRFKSASIGNLWAVMYVFILRKKNNKKNPAYFNLGRFLTSSPKAKRQRGDMGKETEWFRGCLQPGHWKIFALCRCHLVFWESVIFYENFSKGGKEHKGAWGKWQIWDKTNSILTATETILHWLCQERVPFTSELLVSFSVLVWHCMFCGQGAASSTLLI